ncbi:hypothetical protein [Halobellus salinisoli]|uniref:hypothetical protein n=1 Tax=Halobellus salinisoli TaxID=3108500 RepID=UPI00300AB807
MRLGDELESLLEHGSTESRFGTVFNGTLRELRGEWGRSPRKIRDEIHELERDHPLLNFLDGLSRWEEIEDYEGGAELAIVSLRESVELALDENWERIAPKVIEERIRLLDQLNHTEELQDAISEAAGFLTEKEDSIPIGPIFEILDVIIESLNSIQERDTIETILRYTESQADKAIRANGYNDYRHLWRRNLQIRRDTNDLDVKPARGAIIDSYEKQIEFHKERDQHSQRATFAHEAIIECIEWIDDPQRVEWEHEYLDGNKKNINQMAELAYEPSEEDISELDEAIEEIIDRFQKRKSESNTVGAILWLINHDVFKPSIETARDISAGSITNIIQTRTITREGGSYSQDEASGDRPQSYGGMVQMTQNLRQSVYYRLQNRGLIYEGDFFLLFNRRDELSSDNLAYLTDFIIHLFDHNPVAATHIGMPQLEAVLRKLMSRNNKSILQLNSETGELKRRSLSGLLYQIEDDVDEDWIAYMKYWYADLSGQNVRNKISHGHLPYRNSQWGMSIMILFDILQTFYEFDVAY